MHCNRVFAAADAVIPSALIPAQTGNSYVQLSVSKSRLYLWQYILHCATIQLQQGCTNQQSFLSREAPFFHSLLPNCLSVVWVHCFSKEWAQPMWLLPWLPNTGTVTMLPLFFTSFTPADGKILRVVWHCHRGPSGFTESASPLPPNNTITPAIFFPFEPC